MNFVELGHEEFFTTTLSQFPANEFRITRYYLIISHVFPMRYKINIFFFVRVMKEHISLKTRFFALRKMSNTSFHWNKMVISVNET